MRVSFLCFFFLFTIVFGKIMRLRAAITLCQTKNPAAIGEWLNGVFFGILGLMSVDSMNTISHTSIVKSYKIYMIVCIGILALIGISIIPIGIKEKIEAKMIFGALISVFILILATLVPYILLWSNLVDISHLCIWRSVSNPFYNGILIVSGLA